MNLKLHSLGVLAKSALLKPVHIFQCFLTFFSLKDASMFLKSNWIKTLMLQHVSFADSNLIAHMVVFDYVAI